MRYIIGAVVAAMLLPTVVSAASPAPSLGQGLRRLRELNVTTLGNLSSGHDVEGRVFVGGDVSGNTQFGIGSSAHPSEGFAESNRSTLTVVGSATGNVKINNGTNGATGNAVATGSSARALIGVDSTGLGVNPSANDQTVTKVGGYFRSQNFNPNANKTVKYYGGTDASSPFVTKDSSLATLHSDLQTELTHVKSDSTALSAYFAGLATNATFNTFDQNNYKVDFANSADNYFVANVQASDIFNGSHTLNLNLIPLGMSTTIFKPLVINVIGSGNYTYGLNNNDNQHSNDQYVIWNFVSASPVSLSINSRFSGSILGPTVNLSNNSDINGSVLVNSFNQNAEVHLGTFRGQFAGNSLLTAAVPESSTWAMMIVGFGAIGGSMRLARRRRSATA